MRETLHRYLLDRPSGATARELLDLIFAQPGADGELGPRFLHTLLRGDGRFAFAAEGGRWIAAAHAVLARPLDAVTYVVVDLETTGGAPRGGDGIIEIGALRVANGRVVDQFARLVNPRRRLPRFITRLTGITDAMLAEQPGIEVALPCFADFAADAVLIAHNAAFDLGFLNAARTALDGRTFGQPHLCTLRLARQLLPQQRRRSLESLAGHFGVPIVDRHRALGDARMTAEVFFHLLEHLRARGVVRLDQVLDFQHRAGDGRRFVCLLPRPRVAQLPAAPGIYRFSGDGGRLLYIGKAKNLRQRVGTYLSNAAGHRSKTLDLIRHIRDVDVEVAGSELEAALREAEEIRRCQPPYNTLSKHLPQIAFLKLTVSDPFPRLMVTSRLAAGRARYFGPFRSRAAAQEGLALLARLFRLRTCTGRLRPSADASPCVQGQIGGCSMPCAARVGRDQYAGQIAATERFFDGAFGAARTALARRRDAHSAAERFEAAARAQRDLELLDRMCRRHRTLSWIVRRQHFVIMQPAAGARRALLYAVAHGHLVARGAACGADDLAAFAARVETARNRSARPPIQDVDGTIIVAAWLRARGERDGYVFPLAETAPVAGQLPEWTAALHSLLMTDAGAHQRAPQLPAPAEPER